MYIHTLENSLYIHTPTADEIGSDNLPLKLQSLEFTENLGHDVLGSTLRPYPKVPFGPASQRK